MVRYTHDTWRILYPNGNDWEWELKNCPNDLSCFVRQSVAQGLSEQNARTNYALIATIDEQYINWLSNNKKKHSAKNLSKYISSKLNDVDFWTSRLIDSGMTNSYNVLGVPGMFMTHQIDCSKSEYALTKETSEQISQLLADTYQNETVFVPGWVVKGCDLPKCANDMIKLAELFWSDGKRVRFGKFLEQNYSKEELVDKFVPLYFTIPFVIKSKVDCALVDLYGYTQVDQCKTVQSMSVVRFTEDNRSRLLKLISSEIKQFVSIGTNAVMPGHAYMLYNMGLTKNKIVNISMH
jgi:hypothetical protein